MLGVRRRSSIHHLFRALLALGLVFCPLVPLSSASPGTLLFPNSSTGPTGPVEEEKAEETKSGVECATPTRGERRPPAPSGESLVPSPSRIADARAGAGLPRAAYSDVVRNGLGCPLLC